jgi:isoleucyl-tRNA synthetase
VVVLDTELTPDLRAEGDARELQRAIQDARKEAGVELYDEVEVQVDAPDGVRQALAPFLASVEVETRSTIAFGALADASAAVEVDLESGAARIGLMDKAVPR